MQITIYSDAGHAWAKVSRALLVKLGILETISHYSYQKGDNCYLEEDSDLGKLLLALQAAGKTYSFKERVAKIRQSKIRSYQPMIGGLPAAYYNN